MLMQNDQEADQQLLEEPRGNEEVQARAPTRPHQPAREWNGPLLPLKGRNKRRRGFLRRHRLAVALGVPLLLLTGAGGSLYLDYASHFETTDDAFIAARQIAIAPKVSGYLTAVPVTDNQRVVAGQVIARIDDRDYRNALAEAQGQVAAAQASIQNIDRRSRCSRPRWPRTRRRSSRPRRA
jgi:membrane fusion protein, multidrug efflux system